ncbi:unnamed protein product [Dovyalis caffra]|uniref:Ferritin n=1 Tax=Dovyalis caffra TaxID=77055 RepID=A0AAV1S3J4_9ROSI|nr:unnamed protein product [Dovyalis caffra]
MASTFLGPVSSFSLAAKQGDTASALITSPPSDRHGISCSSISALPLLSRKKRNTSLVVSATAETLTGLIFQPFEEVKKEDFVVPIAPQVSLARQYFADESEAAINEQINVEYTASYVYHAMFAFFDRDYVALKGLAKFFKESSEEEREHAEKLMEYQNIRGGRVVLHSILTPPSEFEHVEKGDALYAMELALSLEKLTNEKLLRLHKVACENNDPQMAEFVEREFLGEQVESIKEIAEYVSQLRRVGKGHVLVGLQEYGTLIRCSSTRIMLHDVEVKSATVLGSSLFVAIAGLGYLSFLEL